MVFVKHLRLALIGAAALLSLATPAQASFDFSACAANCVQSSGCSPTNTKCVCSEARSILLDSVVSCLFFNCKADLREFEYAFLSPIESGCEDSHRDIPSSKLKAAESLASSYISKLTPLTTSSSSPAAPTPPPKTTSAPATTSKPAQTSHSTTTSSAKSSSSSSADDESTDESTSSAEETTAAPTRVAAPSPATQLSSTSTRASSSNSNSDASNPFGGSGSSAGSAVRPLLSLLGLPLAIVAMLAAR